MLIIFERKHLINIKDVKNQQKIVRVRAKRKEEYDEGYKIMQVGPINYAEP